MATQRSRSDQGWPVAAELSVGGEVENFGAIGRPQTFDVGPLVDLMDSPVQQAFGRSNYLVWPHFALVFVVITIPLGVEHEVEVLVLVAELVSYEKVWLISSRTSSAATSSG